jgi:O-antigen ligase
MRFAAYGATALTARFALGAAALRNSFIEAFACFGGAVSVISTLAYFTSPSKVLWLFPSPYPDVWGPFLSRNNFAQFLELSLPAALWLGLRGRARAYLLLAAAMLAAGLASASRMGALLLLTETCGVVWLTRRRAKGSLRWFVGPAAVFVAVAGVNTLLTRLADPSPLDHRREIFRSTVEMITTRPWLGYGLGAYAAVYPEFAQFDSGTVVDRAHSDWLEWTAEGGLGFTSLWAAFALALWRPAIRSIWGLGVPALFLHALVDYPFARHGVAAWAFMLAGALAGSISKNTVCPMTLNKGNVTKAALARH